MEKDSHAKDGGAQSSTLLFQNLPEDYKAILVRHYGPQPEPGRNKISAHPIAYVQPLTERENCILDKQFLVSPDFSIQILYKVKGNLEQDAFDRTALELSKQKTALRCNFCELGAQRVKVVFFSRMPEISYRNMEHMSASSQNSALSKIMLEEKQRKFDLVAGGLVRIHVIRTGESEFAVIVTQSVLTALGWSVHELIAGALQVDKLSPENLAGVCIPEQEPELSHGTLAYWKNLLKELPHAPKIPGHKPSAKPYKPAQYELKLAHRDMKSLMERSNGNKNIMMTLLHTAWGLFLQYVSGGLDTYYCLLLPDNCARLYNATATAGLLNPLVIRFSCSEEQKMKDVMGKQFRQTLTSQTYPCNRMQDLCKEIGYKNSNDLFTHFLSFHTFSMDTKTYFLTGGAPDGRVVDMHSWEPGLYDLAIYFHLIEEELRVAFVYNQNNFVFYGIERLAKYYETVLHSFLAHWEHSFEEFELSLHDHLGGVRGNKLDANIKQQKRMNFFSQQELFQELPKQYLKTLAATAQLKTYLENDIIPVVDMEDALLFIMEGTVARSLDHATSILPLDVQKENSWINENVLFPERKFKLSLQVVSEKAHIISLPVSAVRENNELLERISEAASKKINKW